MKSGRLWPWAVAAVLALTVALNVVVWMLANEPESATVEPDYYRKAVAWDSTSARMAHDAKLGWRLDAALGRWAGSAGPTPLVVTLADRDGRPLDGAAIEVTAIHNAIASHPLVFALAPGDAPGRYDARPVLPRRGLWELRFAVRRGPEYFTADLRRDADPPPGVQALAPAPAAGGAGVAR